MTFGERVFRTLLYLYPSAFRRRYRGDLVAFFHGHREESVAKGESTAGFWLATVRDLVRAASVERINPLARAVGFGWESERLYRAREPGAKELPLMSVLASDLRYAIRTLFRSPGFTTVTTLTLGLGIGANAAMFAIVNGVLLRGLPYVDADRVVSMRGASPDGTFGLSENERLIYRDQTEVFASVGVFDFRAVNLTGPNGAERVVAAQVDDGVFRTLGVSAVVGRLFAEDEWRPGGSPVVVLSQAAWQARFAGDPAVLGQSISVNGLERTIVGVLPRGFRLPGDFVGSPVQVYAPLVIAEPDPRNLHYLSAVARLPDWVSYAQAEARMPELGAQMLEMLPGLPPAFTPLLTPVREEVLGDVRPVLLVMLAAVGFVLLIGCVNVANLFLARSDGRAAEMALRAALGAGRGRVVRHVMTESLVLAALGGILGLIVAQVTTGLIVRFDPPNVPRVDQIGVSPTVIAFTAGIATVTALLFGLAPALTASNRDVRTSLHDGGRGGTGGAGRGRLRQTLIVTEVALAVMLAIGAGLLVRSFARLQAVEPGLDPGQVLTALVTLPNADYPNAQSARGFYRDLLRQVRGLPGVEYAGAVSALPFASRPGDWGIRVEGREEERLPSGRRLWAHWMVATEGYFEALQNRMVEGRTLTEADVAGGQPVVIVNETTARRYWPDESALGKRFKMSSDIDTTYRTVVGIAEDVPHTGLDAEPRPYVILPHGQFPSTRDFPMGGMSVVVRTAGDPLALAGPVRAAVAQLDPTVPVSQIRTMGEVLAASTSTERMNVTLIGVFGLLGLLLVSVGVYGVMSYFITQRMRELGIRIALGAAPQSVLGLIVRHGLSLTIIGATLGVGGALALSRLLSNLLYGVTWHDAATFVTIPIVVTAVAMLACIVPARRAVGVDPVVVLKAE